MQVARQWSTEWDACVTRGGYYKIRFTFSVKRQLMTSVPTFKQSLCRKVSTLLNTRGESWDCSANYKMLDSTYQKSNPNARCCPDCQKHFKPGRCGDELETHMHVSSSQVGGESVESEWARRRAEASICDTAQKWALEVLLLWKQRHVVQDWRKKKLDERIMQRKETGNCFQCTQTGHLPKDCKMKGDENVGTGRDTAMFTTVPSALLTTPRGRTSQKSVFDMACTRHILNERSHFRQFVKHRDIVHVEYNETVESYGYGLGHVQASVNSVSHWITSESVIYSPKVRFNALSSVGLGDIFLNLQ